MKMVVFPMQKKKILGYCQEILQKTKTIVLHSKSKSINDEEDVEVSTKTKGRKLQIALIGFLSILLAWGFFSAYNTVYGVTINGKPIGVVKSKSYFTKIVKATEEELHKLHGTEIVLDEDISFKKMKISEAKPTEDAQLKAKLKKVSNFQTTAFGIQANGELIAAISGEKDAKDLLEKVKAAYLEKDVDYEKIGFLEKVIVCPVTTKLRDLKTSKDALSFILQGTEKIETHEVEAGESIWTIAEKCNMTEEELLGANPDIQPEKLQIGQEINLIVPKPLLTVVTLEKKQYEEAIPFETEIEETDTLLKGEQKIKIEGKEGSKEIVAHIEKHNGVEESRDILEEKILEEPQNQVVLQGTRVQPPTTATGSLGMPTRGRLTSRFGLRWGRLHKGIDIAARIGAPVYAADGGKVVFSGTQGAYGRIIVIDHGGGTQTAYAHNSKLLVSRGQRVHKGQKIAEVGNTGRSTGPHLHFEVRKNGSPVNPLKYVR